MNALLFPGQGSQIVGMGKELYDNLPTAKTLLDKADSILGYKLSGLMFNGPQEVLTNTMYAQPAIYTCSAMYLEKVKEQKIDYSFVAGHSLGEFNALLAAGVYDFETGLRLVAARGKVMAAQNGKGTMAAVMGLNEEELRSFLNPEVVMANLNSKTQIVVSGTESGVDSVGKKLEGNESVRFKRLRVSAAFHSPQMAEASEEMKKLIEITEMKPPRCYVISNVTGRPTMSLAEIKANLISQITGQVRWFDTIMAMKSAGVDLLYEVGFGDVLKKMNKAIVFRPKCIGVGINTGV